MIIEVFNLPLGLLNSDTCMSYIRCYLVSKLHSSYGTRVYISEAIFTTVPELQLQRARRLEKSSGKLIDAESLFSKKYMHMKPFASSEEAFCYFTKTMCFTKNPSNSPIKPSDCGEAVVQMHIHSNFLNNKVTF